MNDHPDCLKVQHVLKIQSRESAQPSPTFDPFIADSGVWGVWEDGQYVLAFGLPLPAYTLRFIARRFESDFRQITSAVVRGQRIRLSITILPSRQTLDTFLLYVDESALRWSKIAKAGWTPPVETPEPEFIQASLF